MDLLSPSISSTPKIGTDPLTRKRQSFTVYEMITNNERKQQKQLFNNNCSSSSFDNWNVNNNKNNSKIGQSIRDVMKELTCPTVQFCFGNNIINSQNSSNILLNNLKDRPNINSMPSLINALTQAEQTIMEHNYYLQNRKQQIQQNTRSPSVSGNFSIGLTTTTINKGRRLSERLVNENNNGIIKGKEGEGGEGEGGEGEGGRGRVFLNKNIFIYSL
ncbi:unnamed protein product [Meloidogyne enterolobii]|uniref:Uncharacterized protein n=1 Tax=Meloidogyne enterolobii TaxID=390850 RepID=A0ACB0YYN3_MELEN